MSPPSGQVESTARSITRQAELLLSTGNSWSPEQRQSTARVAARLLDKLPAREFCLVGLGGAPGCGKSTLADLLTKLLANEDHTLVVSLDDYYLGKDERARLAERHPLFAQRGVAGTHDWDTLIHDLDMLIRGQISELVLPRFDKTSDDRLHEADAARVCEAPRIVILEGWLIGAPPQDSAALEWPVNHLEADQDADGIWRRLVNGELARYHRDLRARLDARWFLSVPGWNHVVDWRWQQECEAGGSGKSKFLADREAVSQFLERFERIAVHMKATMHDWADVIIEIDPDHQMHISED